jgi:hypothetical protein
MTNTPLDSLEWNNLDSGVLVLTDELLVYYLYKYSLDKKAKKELQEKEDLYLINYYSKALEKEKEVDTNVFKNTR